MFPLKTCIRLALSSFLAAYYKQDEVQHVIRMCKPERLVHFLWPGLTGAPHIKTF